MIWPQELQFMEVLVRYYKISDYTTVDSKEDIKNIIKEQTI